MTAVARGLRCGALAFILSLGPIPPHGTWHPAPVAPSVRLGPMAVAG